MHWTYGMETAYLSHKREHGASHTQRILEQSIEESAELITALSHLKRGRGDTDEVMEEYADVIVCLQFWYRSMFSSQETFLNDLKRLKDRVSKKTAHLQHELDKCEINRAKHCDECGKLFVPEQETIDTATATRHVTLCRACYNKAGNTVR